MCTLIYGGIHLFKKDALWGAVLAAIAVFLLYPTTSALFFSATAAHPYIMGFIKVSILASMGELLAIRIASGKYKKPKGFIYRFIIWGFIGMTFVVVFDMFASGVAGAMSKGLLPTVSTGTFGGKLVSAFLTSTFMNLIFAPTFMAFHRFTDTFIDLGDGKLTSVAKVKLNEVVKTIDWQGFIGFVVLKTIPLFWIPAHTITFMLPSEYRVLMAASLSIALGGILAFSKRKPVKTSLSM